MKLPFGFEYGGVSCGIKSRGNDVGLLVGKEQVVAAGVYTTNMVRASCIDFNRAITPTEQCKAVFVNSGNANACTGTKGLQNTERIANQVAAAIGCTDKQVLILSTGIIGEQLPMEKIESGIRQTTAGMGQTESHFLSLADAFLTTDKFRKVAYRNLESASAPITLSGIAKGAGMIGPSMATMLSVIVTDAPLTAVQAQSMLKTAVDHSFNRISVDGHTSTNDAVILLASGDVSGKFDHQQFQNALNDVCFDLAKMIPADGEGASHLIAIEVSGAGSDADADKIARTIASSNLVKTAINGCDPNWGRIVSAVGYSGPHFDPAKLSLKINSHLVFENGSPVQFDEKTISKSMAESREISIEIGLNEGAGNGLHWTSDLTTDYVILNSEYHT